ncbi:MAG TPA: hypothetical protein VGB53_00840 [Rubricoccaceae bacterium]|jgi:hypothetical protein
MPVRRIVSASLLSPDRASVVLDEDGLRACVAGPAQFADTYPQAPSAVLPLWAAAPETAAFGLGCVLRFEYSDGSLEAWSVLSRDVDHSGQSSPGAAARLVPFWTQADRRTLIAQIEGTTVATPRLSLVSRTPASALAVAFDPENEAPATSSGAPLFVVASADERYADERVDVSVVGASPLTVLKSVCADLRCLWRAELVRSGDGPEDEVYEISLYPPPEPPTVSDAPFKSAVALPDGSLGRIGNTSGLDPNATSLTVTDDSLSIMTALVPLAASEGEDAVGVGLHAFAAAEVGPLVDGTRTVTLRGRHGEPAPVVPYDGALVGLLLCRLDNDDLDQAWPVVASTAPDQVTVGPTSGGNAQHFGLMRFMRPGTTSEAPRRALVQLVNGPAAETYGVLSEARTYEDIAPHASEFVNGRCDLDGVDQVHGSSPWPLGFLQGLGAGNPVAAGWTDAEASVSVGDRSVQFTSAVAGGVVYAQTSPLAYTGASSARAAWISMRVVSGRVDVTVENIEGLSPPSLVVGADTSETGQDAAAVGGLVLTTVKLVAATAPAGAFNVRFTALDAGTVWVVDALTVVQAPAVQPYRTQMGPNALWARAWSDLLASPRRATTAESEFFDLAGLGLGDEPVTSGMWVEVAASGREPFAAQVLDIRWREGLLGDGPAPDRRARLGPPPEDLVSRLSSPASRALAPPGSKRAPEYPYLIDRGPTEGGRLVEAGPGATITQGTATRTFRTVTHEVPTLSIEDELVRTLVVRRIAGRTDAATLLLSPPD